MTTVLRSRLCLRDAARRIVPNCSYRIGVRGAPVVRIRAPSHYAHQRAYFAGVWGGTGSPGSKAPPEPLKNATVDEIEQRLRERMGDHATWSHEKLKNLIYHDSPIPLEHFLYFTYSFVEGMLPGGGKPSYPLMTREELSLLEIPYREWAAPPYNTLEHSCRDRLQPLYLSQGVPFRARQRVLRKKLWHGMVPLSRERWLEKKLDDPKNYRMFFELMQDIIDLFLELNHEPILEKMREQFNQVVDVHVEFEGAVNLRREQMGVREQLDMAGMWAEYYQAIVSTMTERTHKWLVDRVEEIQARAFTEYTAAIKKHRRDVEAIGLASREYYQCVQDLNALMTTADAIIGVPMTGFRGYTTSNDFSDLSTGARRDKHLKFASAKDWTYMNKIMEAQERDGPEEPKDTLHYVEEMKNGPKPAPPRFQDSELFIDHYYEGRRNYPKARKMLRGVPKALGEEYWITVLKAHLENNAYYPPTGEHWDYRFGFPCYRITYGQTDAEWAEFWKKLFARRCILGEWVQGFETVLNRAYINIMDGREYGIAEGDVEAAKKHYRETFGTIPALGHTWTNDFLVIDQECYESHVKPLAEETRPPPPYGPCFGDNGGFLRLVDTQEYSHMGLDDCAPGYTGQMRVLSSLLLTEVYPLLASNALRPIDMWPLARLHPNEVYVGHTVGAQEYWWENNRIDRAAITKSFLDLLRKKNPGLEG